MTTPTWSSSRVRRISSEVAYVQVEPSETDGEWLFECVVENEKAREVAYHFVMAHEYDDGEHRREDKWTH